MLSKRANNSDNWNVVISAKNNQTSHMEADNRLIGVEANSSATSAGVMRKKYEYRYDLVGKKVEAQ